MFFFHFYHQHQTSTDLGIRAPKVPIIISIQLSASKPFLIINSGIREKTAMFHGRGSKGASAESCNATDQPCGACPQREEFRALRWLKPGQTQGAQGLVRFAGREHGHSSESTRPVAPTVRTLAAGAPQPHKKGSGGRRGHHEWINSTCQSRISRTTSNSFGPTLRNNSRYL